MTVQSVMTTNPACCTPTTSLRDVARLMLDNDCGQIPVIDDSTSHRPIGVITDRDITVRMVANGVNPLDSVAGECMSTPCITVTSESSLRECCEVMEASKIRRVPVVDSTGRVCGIVSLADVARCGDAADTVEVVKEVSMAN